jgi:urate oxidase
MAEVADRIFSTSVTAEYNVTLPPNLPLSVENLPAIAKQLNFPSMQETVRTDILEVFAEDESASVQATLYNTLQKILKDCPDVKEGSMSLPNKHYMYVNSNGLGLMISPVNLSAFGLENGLGYEGGAEVFHPTADPSGLITATVTRK